jgi:hypothetical protein
MIFALRRRHLHLEVDRWGNRRVYFRVGRGQPMRIREVPGTEEFDKRYHELMRRWAAGELKAASRDAPTLGTFRWLCIEHFKSTAFTQLDPRTQHVTRLIDDKMFQEPIAPGAKELFGDCLLSRFDAKAVLRDRRADRPEAANNRVRPDVVQLGKQHLRNGWLVFRQFKGRNRAPLMAEVPILRELRSVVDASDTGDLTSRDRAWSVRPGSGTGLGIGATRQVSRGYRRMECARPAPRVAAWRDGSSADGDIRLADDQTGRVYTRAAEAQTTGWGGDAFCLEQMVARNHEGKRSKKLSFFNACLRRECLF